MRCSYTILILTITALTLSSCYTDQEDSVTITKEELPTTETESDLFGSLITPDNDVIEDYTLEIKQERFTVNGDYFYLENVPVSKKGQLIEAYQGSELIGLGTPYLMEFDINKIELTSALLKQEIELSGTEILTGSFGDGTDVVLSILKTDVNNNDLNCLVYWVNSEKISQAYGLAAYQYLPDTKEVNYLVLDPIAGFHLSIDDENESSALMDDAYFGLSFSTEMNGKSLFHYNEGFGYWVYESEITTSTITLQNEGHYMIADHQLGQYVEGQLDYNSKPLSYVKTQLDNRNNFYFTTEKGRWGAVVPVSAPVIQTLLSPCDEQLNSVELSISETGAVSTETVTLSEENVFGVQTKILDCNGDLSDDAALQLTEGNQSELYFFSESALDLQLIVCNNPIGVASYDQSTQMQGPSISWSTNSEDQLDYLVSCEALQEGFTYLKVKDFNVLLNPFSVEVSNGVTTLSSEENDMKIFFQGDEAKPYTVDQVNIFMNRPDFGSSGYAINCTSDQGCGLSDFQVTHFESGPDGWFRVSFQGELWMQTIENPVAGYFPVEGLILTRI